MIVENTKVGVLVIPLLGKSNVITGNLILLPGCNEVPREKWEAARVHAKPHIDRGVVREIAAKVEQKKNASGKVTSESFSEVREFKDLPPSDAERVVKKTFSLSTLEDWKQKEVRESVRLAIVNQIETVKKEGTKPATPEEPLTLVSSEETESTPAAGE